MKWVRGQYEWNRDNIYEEDENGVLTPVCLVQNPKYTELILELPIAMKLKQGFQNMSWSMHQKIPADKS
jgi:hypothetical protein